MLDNNFTAAITLEDLLIGEARHADGEQSRKLAILPHHHSSATPIAIQAGKRGSSAFGKL